MPESGANKAGTLVRAMASPAGSSMPDPCGPGSGRSAAVRDEGRMVAARLSGGLGNQLFQFAAARRLAQSCAARLVLDATPFTLPQERRTYALSPYPIDAAVVFDGYASSPIRPRVVLPRPRGVPIHPYGLVNRIADRLTGRPGAVEGAVSAVASHLRRARGGTSGLQVFRESTFDYDPAFMALGAGTYLDGYWQSYRYFDGVRDIISRELTLPLEPNSLNREWLVRIRSANAVCIHVRRGDYLMADHFADHGVCSPDYYARAMRLVAERAESPRFFVFSDDLAWSRAHFAAADVAFVDANPPAAAHDELKLMAACRHHIIANSSLSWWGAWLARHDGQIVIAPDPWFSTRNATPDLFPADWIALPRG
jgi:hypothetical protein